MFRSLVFATTLACAGAAGAATVTVDSVANSSNLNAGAATGLFLAAGQGFTVTADPTDTWSLGANDPGCTREANADGLTACFGNYSQGGLSALYGTLVGSIGAAGQLFAIGTDFAGLAGLSGELFLYNFDSYEGDNAGSIAATVAAAPVPLPAGGVLLLGAFAGLGALRRSRKAV